MNTFSQLFANICNGNTITLEKNKVYHVSQDDSFILQGYYCTNTAKKHENPSGLRNAAVFLKEKKDIVIDGNGASLLIHGKMTPFLFDKCENITVKNLTVDYSCPTMTEFTVLRNNNGVCDIKINSDCNFRTEGNTIIWYGETDKNGKPYWEDTHNGNGRYFKIFNPQTKLSRDYRRDSFNLERIEKLDERTLRIYFENKENSFPEGCIIQTRSVVRDQTGSLFQRCKNLCFENLRIKFMHGLGMVSQYCESITYKNCDLTPNENRTVASTADFFQFSGCKGNIIIENCKAHGAHDDYINVHGTHLQIAEKNDSENSIIVRFMHPESWGFQAFEVGDIIEFIKWDTLIPYESAEVISYERIDDTNIKLFLNKKLPEIVAGKDSVENATWTPNVYVRNCDFGETSGRGILCTTRGEVIIENNRFEKLNGPALLIEDDCNFWFESGYTKKIIFRNNFMSNCEYAEMWQGAPFIRYTPKVMNEKSKEFVHGKLVVENNVFEKTFQKEHLIWLEYLEELELRNNKFDKPYRIETKCVGKIIDENNI